MQPVARKDKLTIRELADETLIYDLERHTMHCLNRASALVWKHCDGQHDVAALALLLGRELGLAAAEANAATRLALEQLGRRQLLKEAIPPPAEAERVTRRTALRKLAVAAAVAIPLVMTLKSPSVAWAQGGCINGTPCNPGNPCMKLGTCLNIGGTSITGPHGSIITPNLKTQCVSAGPVPDGSSCGSGMVCMGGNCMKQSNCGQQNASCTPSNGNNGTRGTCCNGCVCLNGSCSCFVTGEPKSG